MADKRLVLIIGAGISGLAAASKLGEAGLPVLLLEARERIGGRILTQRDSAGNAIDLGAEFIHGRAPEILEPLKECGVEILEVGGESWCATSQGLVPGKFFPEVDAILEAMDDSSPDESFLDFLQRRFPNPSRDAQLEEAKQRAVSYVSGFNAADPGLVGAHWLVHGMRAEEKIEGHRAFRPIGGYEKLLSAFQKRIATYDVKVQTNAVVERVTWKAGSAEVTTHSRQGPVSINASQVLITLPLALLKADAGQLGKVEFVPPLPPEKIASLEKLEVGKVVRVGLRFRDRFWENISLPNGQAKSLSRMSFLFSQNELFPTWWTAMPAKLPIITGWAPFRSAERLAQFDRSAIVAKGMQVLGDLLGMNSKTLKKRLEEAYFHDWQADPFSRGAYCYGKVGSDGAQQALGAPIANTLFFAGEATDTSGNNGTVHGAIASAYRAAQEIIYARST
jgi:monoamine oxidase